MAIKFVDIEPEGEGKPKRAKQSEAPPVAREPDAEAPKESVDSELSHTKPVSKKRGRKYLARPSGRVRLRGSSVIAELVGADGPASRADMRKRGGHAHAGMFGGRSGVFQVLGCLAERRAGAIQVPPRFDAGRRLSILCHCVTNLGLLFDNSVALRWHMVISSGDAAPAK